MKKRIEPPVPLTRGQIDQLAIDLAFHELEAEEKRRTLLRHYREGARLPKKDSWLLRGHEWDLLLTRAGVVSIRNQEKLKSLPGWLRGPYFFRIFVARDDTKELMHSSPGELPARICKLLKLSRHWRIKPERRRAAESRSDSPRSGKPRRGAPRPAVARKVA